MGAKIIPMLPPKTSQSPLFMPVSLSRAAALPNKVRHAQMDPPPTFGGLGPLSVREEYQEESGIDQNNHANPKGYIKVLREKTEE
jgi:hypothetical protein